VEDDDLQRDREVIVSRFSPGEEKFSEALKKWLSKRLLFPDSDSRGKF